MYCREYYGRVLAVKQVKRGCTATIFKHLNLFHHFLGYQGLTRHTLTETYSGWVICGQSLSVVVSRTKNFSGTALNPNCNELALLLGFLCKWFSFLMSRLHLKCNLFTQTNIFFYDILEFLLPFILKNPVYIFISQLISQAEHTVIVFLTPRFSVPTAPPSGHLAMKIPRKVASLLVSVDWENKTSSYLMNQPILKAFQVY